jgi:hypothetical protein
MFRRRIRGISEKDISPVQSLAARLGVERRYSPRAKFPDQAAFVTMPAILFDNQVIRMRDLSIGGCCLWDHKELLGPSIGQEVVLTLRWSDSEDQIRARIVSRVDHCRHIQFLDLPISRQEQIKVLIAPGIAGLEMRPANSGFVDGLTVEAQEIWTSLKGDALTIEEDIHRLASAHILGEDIYVLREAWPITKDKSPASPRLFEALLLFLANIPNPSKSVKNLQNGLVKMSTVRSA